MKKKRSKIPDFKVTITEKLVLIHAACLAFAGDADRIDPDWDVLDDIRKELQNRLTEKQIKKAEDIAFKIMGEVFHVL